MFGGTHSLLQVLRKGKHTVHEGVQFPGWRRLCPAAHHCHIPACQFFMVASTGWEPSWSMRGITSPEGSPLSLCLLFFLSYACVFTITARTSVQSKGMVTVTFLGRKAAPLLPVSGGSDPYIPRAPVVEGQRVPIRYWIDARAHIFERQVLLMFVCFLYNQRWGIILERTLKKKPIQSLTTFFFLWSKNVI